jgi:uncharacterized protein (TIGR03067 family)
MVRIITGGIMRNLIASMLMFGMTAVLVHAQPAGARLDGVWLLIGTDDKKLTKEFFDKAMVQLILKNGEYEQNIKGMKAESGTYKFDPAKSPPTIDIAIRDGKDKGKTQLGIYKLDGDNLMIAFGRPGSAVRPKNFDIMQDVDLTIFKRSK